MAIDDRYVQFQNMLETMYREENRYSDCVVLPEAIVEFFSAGNVQRLVHAAAHHFRIKTGTRLRFKLSHDFAWLLLVYANDQELIRRRDLNSIVISDMVCDLMAKWEGTKFLEGAADPSFDYFKYGNRPPIKRIYERPQRELPGGTPQSFYHQTPREEREWLYENAI